MTLSSGIARCEMRFQSAVEGLHCVRGLQMPMRSHEKWLAQTLALDRGDRVAQADPTESCVQRDVPRRSHDKLTCIGAELSIDKS